MQVLAKIREQTMTRNIDCFLTGRNRREIQKIANRMSSHISGNYIQKPQQIYVRQNRPRILLKGGDSCILNVWTH